MIAKGSESRIKKLSSVWTEPSSLYVAWVESPRTCFRMPRLTSCNVLCLKCNTFNLI